MDPTDQYNLPLGNNLNALKRGNSMPKKYSDHFENFWKTLPREMKIGKKNAYRHYKTSVVTDDDRDRLQQALENYKNTRRFKSGYIQNGSTWVNNWEDWLEYREPMGIQNGKKLVEETPVAYIYDDGSYEIKGDNDAKA